MRLPVPVLLITRIDNCEVWLLLLHFQFSFPLTHWGTFRMFCNKETSVKLSFGLMKMERGTAINSCYGCPTAQPPVQAHTFRLQLYKRNHMKCSSSVCFPLIHALPLRLWEKTEVTMPALSTSRPLKILCMPTQFVVLAPQNYQKGSFPTLESRGT